MSGPVDGNRRQVSTRLYRPNAGLRSPTAVVVLVILVLLPIVAACSSFGTLPPTPTLAPTPAPTMVAVATTIPLHVSTTHLPTQPLEPGGQVDFTAVVTNPNHAPVEGITLQLTLSGSDGRTAVDLRQQNLSLQPNGSRAVSWLWEVPDYMLAGDYRVGTRALDPTGRTLSSVEASGNVLQITAASALVRPRQVGPAAAMSPFICGANIDPQLADNLDVAKQLGITTLRFGPDINYSRYLKAIKSAGLQPLIILRGAATPDAARRLALNQQLVREAQAVFGFDTRLFYEVGNENDLESGLDSSAYTAMWNAMVPELKKVAPNSWFGGPVNFQANPAYTASLVHDATPKPDFVSWHEYTCPSDASAGDCTQHITNWTDHIANIKAAIQANADVVPPMMVTEWNYAPDGGVTSDNKHGDAVFMSSWTTSALQTLVDNNVYGAYQFNVYGVMPLLDSPQGQALQSVCNPSARSGAGSTPIASVVPSATPSPGRGTVPDYRPTGAVLAHDSFDRPDQSTWASASGGLQWGADANRLQVFSIRNRAGYVSGGSGAYDAVLDSASGDVEVLFTGSMSSFVYSNLGAVVRWSDANNWYKAYIDGANLVLQKRVGGAYTVLAMSDFPAAVNTSYSLRLQSVGSSVAAKVWPTDGPEPADWLVKATDTSFQTGKFGLRLQVLGNAAATYTSFAAYGLSASAPTPTPTSTSTARSESTPSPTIVPPAAPTPVAGGAKTDAIVQVFAANVHKGPGTSYTVFSSIKLGERYSVADGSSSAGWVQVCCIQGRSGWVLRTLVTLVPSRG